MLAIRAVNSLPLPQVVWPTVVLAAAISVAGTFLLSQMLVRQDGGVEWQEAPQDVDELHFAWVSDCSEYQEWQSWILLWSILQHMGSDAVVTWLISGCSEAQRSHRWKRHQKLFPTHHALRLFFTAAHVRDEALNDTYPPYNRPHAILHWVRTAALDPRAWVVLLDPDMLMLTPLKLPSYSAGAHRVGPQISGGSAEEIIYRGRAPLVDALGLPAMGQRYKYLGARWEKAALRLDDICEAGYEGCLRLGGDELAEFYSAGPPWIVRFGDLKRAAPLWQAYVPRVRRQYRHLIAEMYAYSLAFASLRIRHALFDHFVVSYPGAPAGEQAWSWVDGAGPDADGDSCASEGPLQGPRLPSFLHYCEIYHVEDWYFQKRDVPHGNALSCEAPLFAEPPQDMLHRARATSDVAAEAEHRWERQRVRQAWFLCALLSAMNRAAIGLRRGLCPHGFNSSRSFRVPFPHGDFYEALQGFFRSMPSPDSRLGQHHATG